MNGYVFYIRALWAAGVPESDAALLVWGLFNVKLGPITISYLFAEFDRKAEQVDFHWITRNFAL